MKRYPAFDPPEYVGWTRDAAAVADFESGLDRDEARREIVDALGVREHLDLYRGLVRTRLIDIGLKRLVRQGVISKAWLGTGEEAATVGPVHALRRPAAGVPAGEADVVGPMIRNSGACSEMGMPIADIFRAYMGTADAPTRGRDGHYGDLARGVLPPISHVGDLVPVITGIAMSFQARKSDRVALTWIGDGSAKAGVAHEGLNFAAVRRVPAVFIIQNNQVALGTRLDQHHLAAGTRNFSDWPAAYGMWGAVFDGNHVLDAFAATALAVRRCRAGQGPALLIAETFRMGGHATHDEAEARRTFDSELFHRWGRRDPIGLYETWLVEQELASEDELQDIESEIEREVDRAQEEALASRRDRMPAPESAVHGVYAARDGEAGEPAR